MLPDWYEAGSCNLSLTVALAHEPFTSQLATHRTLKENDIIEFSTRKLMDILWLANCLLAPRAQ